MNERYSKKEKNAYTEGKTAGVREGAFTMAIIMTVIVLVLVYINQ